MQSRIAGSLNDLGVRRPRLVIFGYTLLEVKFDKTDFPSPIEAFRQMKILIDHKLSNVKPTDRPSLITNSYAEITRMADLTRCHYKEDTSVFAELYNYDLEYTRRGKAWIGWPVLE